MKLFGLFKRKPAKPSIEELVEQARRRPVSEKPAARRAAANPAPDGANPYETHSWKADPIKGLRRVEDSKTARRDRGKGDANNPYNTGVFTKGW